MRSAHLHACLNSGGSRDQVSVMLGPASRAVVSRCYTCSCSSLAVTMGIKSAGALHGLGRTLPGGTEGVRWVSAVPL